MGLGKRRGKGLNGEEEEREIAISCTLVEWGRGEQYLGVLYLNGEGEERGKMRLDRKGERYRKSS